ncbi:phage antirepressor KilAC domain-containing protein [Brevibacillus laterosporus]|uniref:phage antirepressor KilAC domain-containing protein n=1 Tax=Brevibacillus laterosporus TaxID=1465 RepID=UPI003459552E
MKTQAPKVEMFETLISAGNSQTMAIVAKPFNIGRNTLFSFLRKHKILMPKADSETRHDGGH